jgi:hypothetical protein
MILSFELFSAPFITCDVFMSSTAAWCAAPSVIFLAFIIKISARNRWRGSGLVWSKVVELFNENLLM